MGMRILLQLVGCQRCHRGGRVGEAPGKTVWVALKAGWVVLLPGMEVMCVELMGQRLMVRQRSEGRLVQSARQGRKRV